MRYVALLPRLVRELYCQTIYVVPTGSAGPSGRAV